MRITHLFVPAIAATLILSACGGSPPPPPSPSGPTQAEIDARNDSIAAARAAESARTEAEREAARREAGAHEPGGGTRPGERSKRWCSSSTMNPTSPRRPSGSCVRSYRSFVTAPRSASAWRDMPTSGARRSTTSRWEAGVPRVCGTSSRASGLWPVGSPRPRSEKSGRRSTGAMRLPGLRTVGSTSWSAVRSWSARTTKNSGNLRWGTG